MMDNESLSEYVCPFMSSWQGLKHCSHSCRFYDSEKDDCINIQYIPLEHALSLLEIAQNGLRFFRDSGYFIRCPPGALTCSEITGYSFPRMGHRPAETRYRTAQKRDWGCGCLRGGLCQ